MISVTAQIRKLMDVHMNVVIDKDDSGCNGGENRVERREIYGLRLTLLVCLGYVCACSSRFALRFHNCSCQGVTPPPPPYSRRLLPSFACDSHLN